MKTILHLSLIITLGATLISCKKQAIAQPSKQVSTLGTVEVTAKLQEIRGDFPPNKLYDYAYVMKYKVLKTHRGSVAGDTIYVAHYNPLKPRATAADKFVKDIGGNVDRFRVGDLHRMALDAPLDQLYMGGIIDKHIQEKATRYWAIWTEKAESENRYAKFHPTRHYRPMHLALRTARPRCRRHPTPLPPQA